MRPKTETKNERAGAANHSAAAFTLIEMIGVLTILAILAAAITPVFIKRLDSAAYHAEQTSLASLADALRLEITQNKDIPGQSDCFPKLANWLSVPVSEAGVNKRHNARAYLMDASGWLPANGWTNNRYGSGNTYFAGTNGVPVVPTNARVMFVSSIGKPLPSGLLGGTSPSPADFTSLWNSPAGTVPTTGVWSGWNGKAEDVAVQRLNLQPLFHQVILNNFATNNAACFTIDANTTGPVYVPYSGPGWNAFYLDGSVLGLNSNATIQARYVLKRNASFVFEGTNWLSEILNGRAVPLIPMTNDPAVYFANDALVFFNSDENPYTVHIVGDSKSGYTTNVTASQGAVLNAMNSFMLDYISWSAMDFSATTYAKKKKKKDYMETLLKNDLVNLTDKGKGVAGTTDGNKSGVGGLLDKGLDPIPP